MRSSWEKKRMLLLCAVQPVKVISMRDFADELWTARRKALIKILRENGLTLAEIGAEIGISAQRVAQIIKGT